MEKLEYLHLVLVLHHLTKKALQIILPALQVLVKLREQHEDHLLILVTLLVFKAYLTDLVLYLELPRLCIMQLLVQSLNLL